MRARRAAPPGPADPGLLGRGRRRDSGPGGVGITVTAPNAGSVDRRSVSTDTGTSENPLEVVRVDMQVAVAADIVVTGRNVEVPAHYRVHIAEKLARLERYGSHVSRILRYDVVLDHEKNPRLSKVCQRVEITGRGTGPTVRAEACGPDFHSVLDAAVAKLQETLRRSHDRRRVHHGRHQPISVAAATAPLATAPLATAPLTAAVVTDPDPRRFASTNPPSAAPRRGPLWVPRTVSQPLISAFMGADL